MGNERQKVPGQVLGISDTNGETRQIKTDDNGNLLINLIGNTLVEQKTQADATYIAEVASLSVTSVCTTNGNVTVSLNGVNTNVALVTTDNTTALVATKIRNATFAGWTTGGTGNTVTFTATSSGNKTDATYNAGTTGATGTMTTTTQGTDNYVVFSDNVSTIELNNIDSSNTGVFKVNGINITVPATKSFKANVGGTPSANVYITGSTSYIITRYV